MSHHWGYVAAVASAILFGLSSTLNKIVLENVNPTVMAGLIYFVAGADFTLKSMVKIDPWR